MNIFELIHKYEKIVILDDLNTVNAKTVVDELKKLVEDEQVNINFDYCPCCHSDQKKMDNSLHCWCIEYDCGCMVCGSIENNQFIFKKNCLDT